MRMSRFLLSLAVPCALAAALTAPAPASVSTTSVVDWGDNSAGELGNGA
jgi:hypothetical protein